LLKGQPDFRALISTSDQKFALWKLTENTIQRESCLSDRLTLERLATASWQGLWNGSR